MPVSPSRKAEEEQKNGTTQESNGSEPKAAPLHPGRKKRQERQRKREKYAKLREDLQITGDIPTTPEGALRNERVDPRLQGCQQLPEVIRQALRENWNTPDAAKPAIIGALLEPFFADDVVLDKDGNQIRVPPNRLLLIELAKMLRQLDQTQYERDNPEAAGKARGGQSVSVQTNIAAAQMVREMIQERTPIQLPSNTTITTTQQPAIERQTAKPLGCVLPTAAPATAQSTPVQK